MLDPCPRDLPDSQCSPALFLGPTRNASFPGGLRLNRAEARLRQKYWVGESEPRPRALWKSPKAFPGKALSLLTLRQSNVPATDQTGTLGNSHSALNHPPQCPAPSFPC